MIAWLKNSVNTPKEQVHVKKNKKNNGHRKMPHSGPQPTLRQLRLDAAFLEAFCEMRLNRRELDRYFGPTLWLARRAPGMEANIPKRYARETDEIQSYGAWWTLAGVPTAIGSSCFCTVSANTHFRGVWHLIASSSPRTFSGNLQLPQGFYGD